MIPHLRPTIEAEDLRAVEQVLSGRMLAEGELAARLAQRFNDLAGGAGAAACGSGTQALVMALHVAGIGRSSRVALPTYVCPSVFAAIRHLGGVPVFCDSAQDLLIDPDQAMEAARTCEAVIVPHVLGNWRDVSGLRGRKAVIIEDFAQYLCLPKQGFPGLCGDLGVFSLQATKILCAGEGGIVAAATPELAARLNELKRLNGSAYGLSLYPLSDLQAALGLAQLDRLGDFVQRRARIATAYRELVRDLPGLSIPTTERSMHFRFPLFVEGDRDLDGLIAAFARQGVAVRRPVDTLAHRFAAGCEKADFPVAQRAWERILSLPIYPGLADGERDAVMTATRQVLSGAA